MQNIRAKQYSTASVVKLFEPQTRAALLPYSRSYPSEGDPHDNDDDLKLGAGTPGIFLRGEKNGLKVVILLRCGSSGRSEVFDPLTRLVSG
jgi:hypothetical protein